MNTQFEYVALPLRDVLALAAARGMTEAPDGSYLSDDGPTRAVARAFADGFRWVRTEGDFAVFERVVPAAPVRGIAAARGFLADALRALAPSQFGSFGVVGDAVAQIADLRDALVEVEKAEGGL